jgi:hypothetical protein
VCGTKKDTESDGLGLSPINLFQLSQINLLGTKKKKLSIIKLSIIGNNGVDNLAKAVIETLNVSPGKTSSQ